MNLYKLVSGANLLLTAVRKGQLIIEKQERVKDILNKNQIAKQFLDTELGPKKPRNRKRFQKVT